MFIYPEFAFLVRRGNRIAVEHQGDGVYYRTAGAWEVHTELVDGMYLESRSDIVELNGHQLVGCTREEWNDDNWGYTPETRNK